MAATMNAATFMGKNFSTIQSFVKNFEDLTLKQMFDITAKLVSDQDEINGLDRDYDGIDGEPTEFEWNIFPGFTTLQLCGKVNDLLSDLGETPETFTGRILFMSMFNDISCDRKGNKEKCLANARVVKVFAKKFGIGQWSFIGRGSEKKWYSGEENSPQ